jgi:phosphonoacetaldehyde hydrolase
MTLTTSCQPTRAKDIETIQAVIFDWAGTLVDFGSFAPTSIFIEAFRQGYSFDISLEEARQPMGLGKWDHIQAIGQIPTVAARWETQFGTIMQPKQVDEIYNLFMPLQIAKVAEHAQPIPGAVELLNTLKAAGIKIGSCSGYPRQVMTQLIPAAAAYGIRPDSIVATDDLPSGGRPGPFMALKNVIDLAITDVAACIKVDDALPGIEEGRNAGMWTVGILLTGNEAGLTLEEYHTATPEQLDNIRHTVGDKFAAAGTHYTVDSVAELPAVLADINLRICRGERPD